MSDLQGKTALITGSTSGIGKAIAEKLASHGANIILSGRRPAREVRAQQKEMEKKYGIKTIYCRADMAKPKDIEMMFRRAAETIGSPDILVNNAGSQHIAPVKEFPLEKWKNILDVHVTASFLAIKAALPHMEEQGWGRIINIGSSHSETASPFKSAYITAKHGILGLSKAVSTEVADKGITCNTICPGYVKTPLVEGQIQRQAETRGLKPEQVEQEVFLDAHMTRKFTTLEEIADAAHFLICKAGNMTGKSIVIDGGWTAGRAPRMQPAAAPK